MRKAGIASGRPAGWSVTSPVACIRSRGAQAHRCYLLTAGGGGSWIVFELVAKYMRSVRSRAPPPTLQALGDRRMRLRNVRVRMFRNILDSTEVKIDEKVTCLVGKNESG